MKTGFGRTTAEFWFVAPEAIKPSGGLNENISSYVKHFAPAGTLVRYDRAQATAFLIKGERSGWGAPYVHHNVIPLSPLELLASVAE